jgi:hypothetical protein
VIVNFILSMVACGEPELRRARCYDTDFFETLDRAEHRERVEFCKDILVKYDIDRKLRMPFYDELMVDPTLLEDPDVCAVVLQDVQDRNASIALYGVWVTARYKALYPDRALSCVEAAFPDGPPVTGWLPKVPGATNPGNVGQMTRDYLAAEWEVLEEQQAIRKQLGAALPECRPATSP